MPEVVEQATLTVDLVLFAGDGPVGPVVHVLLINGKFGWCLPGGKVRQDEEIEDALKRESLEEIGIEPLFAVPVGAFPQVGRDHRGRYVSFVYTTTLTTPDQIEVTAGSDAKEARWWRLDSLPTLAFDHRQIIEEALRV